MSVARIPIISLYSNLIVPIQGTIVDAAIARLREDVTKRIDEESAHGLIIDVSGISMMDSFVTRSIRDLALTARLMGVHTVVSGLQSQVAITLVEMGLDIPGIQTALNLERALEYLLDLQEQAAGGMDLTDAT